MSGAMGRGDCAAAGAEGAEPADVARVAGAGAEVAGVARVAGTGVEDADAARVAGAGAEDADADAACVAGAGAEDAGAERVGAAGASPSCPAANAACGPIAANARVTRASVSPQRGKGRMHAIRTASQETFLQRSSALIGATRALFVCASDP